MVSAIDRLLRVAGPSLSEGDVSISEASVGAQAEALEQLLAQRNGFYAFEGALHVFPGASSALEIGIFDWNAENLWVSAYGGLAKGRFFFAEDIFGGQFFLNQQGVFAFDPEAATDEFIAATLEDWANAILKDFDVLTGYPLAHQWQQLHGRLQRGHRLVPKIPFVAGGEFAVANLSSMDAVKGMLARAELALQIKELPDGTPIKLRLSD